jgi:hypothetical protein
MGDIKPTTTLTLDELNKNRRVASNAVGNYVVSAGANIRHTQGKAVSNLQTRVQNLETSIPTNDPEHFRREVRDGTAFSYTDLKPTVSDRGTGVSNPDGGYVQRSFFSAFDDECFIESTGYKEDGVTRTDRGFCSSVKDFGTETGSVAEDAAGSQADFSGFISRPGWSGEKDNSYWYAARWRADDGEWASGIFAGQDNTFNVVGDGLRFFDWEDPVVQQTAPATGATAEEKVDAVITALTAYGLLKPAAGGTIGPGVGGKRKSMPAKIREIVSRSDKHHQQ